MKRTLALLLATLPLCANAQVFRWVDENGKVHYGDRPVAKEVKVVPVLREAKPQESLPTPGMKAEEVRKKYGEPDRVQDVQTKSGSTVIWTYRKSKLVPKDFIAKIDGGEVSEVSTDSWTENGQPLAAPKARGTEGAAADAAAVAARQEAYQQQAASRAEAARNRHCEDLRANQRRVADAERRGGSAATMDRFREERRSYDEQMRSSGCGS